MKSILNPRWWGVLCLLLVVVLGCEGIGQAQQPKVGDTMKPVTWTALDGKAVFLTEVNKKSPVVLVVLRGFPGYQCPICTAQVGSLMGSKSKFAAAKAEVILVYPGPAEGLKAHADEFVTGKQLPKNFRMVLDPDYAFVKQYGLRWNAPGETSYPSTFVLNKSGKVVYAKVSKSHGGRADTGEILKALGQ